MTKELRLESLAARAESVTLPNGLVMDEVVLTSGPAEAQLKPFGLVLERPGTFEVTVLEKSVAEFLESQSPAGISKFTVKASGGKVTVEATAKMALGARISADCRLRIDGGRLLIVELESVSLPLARGLIEQQLAKINPIMNVADLPGAFQLSDVVVDSGALRFRGTLDWNGDEGQGAATEKA